jgi:hypothetical protein
MRRVFSIILTVIAALGVLALQQDAAAQQRPDPTRAQIDAATADAIRALKRDIRAAAITPSLTVGDFAKQTDSNDALDEAIERAQQIGGPRWIDDQTCQVKLEVDGARVARSLVSIAAVRPRVSPLPAAALEQRIANWKNRSFTATGTSISADRVPVIRPSDTNLRWSSITDDDRRLAVAAARQDAARKLIDSIRPIEYGPGKTFGDVVSREPVQKAVTDWVASQPVTQLRYDDNMEVELMVATPPDALLQTVMASAGATQGTTLPSDEQTLEALQREFSRRTTSAVGRAKVSHGDAAPTTAVATAAIDLPDRAPEWVFHSLDAEGNATAAKTRLLTQSAATGNATDLLRSRVNALNLTPDLTIGDAAKANPRIAAAVERAVLRARLYKVDYHADGSAMARMMLDPRDLWNELRQATSR